VPQTLKTTLIGTDRSGDVCGGKFDKVATATDDILIACPIAALFMGRR